ncbi:MAG: DMT family transporter [Gammaproteobacteria bacterium]|nr:DMT family transporter [Gammaproteobacteria bacterium]
MNIDRQTRLSIVNVVCGLCIAALVGALMKYLTDSMSVFQITWLRFLGQTVLLLPIALWVGGADTFRPSRPTLQIVRGLTLSGATLAFVTGARTTDFADAIAILYAYPFLLTVIAVIFLGERVRLGGWISVAGGFIGVLLVIRPQFDHVDVGALWIFLCAMIVSSQMAINRKLGSLSHPMITTFLGGLVATLSLSIFVPFYWSVIPLELFWVIVVMVLLGAVSQALLVYGFSKAEASTLAPFTYFEIIAAVIIGLMMFGTVPDWISVGGIILIIGCGMAVARSISDGKTVRQSAKF